MTTGRLDPNDAPAVAWSSGTLANQTNYGLKAGCNDNGYLLSVAWYRPSSANGPPRHLQVWDAAVTSAPIFTAPAVPDNGNAGWQRWTLTGTVPLTSGHAYVVATTWDSGQHVPLTATPTADSQWTMDDHPDRYVQADGTFPGSTAADQDWAAMDVQWSSADPASGGGGGASVAQVDAEFAAWMSATSGTNTHHDDLPWLDHAILASDSFGLAVLKTAVDAIKTKTDALPGSINDVLGAVLDTLVSDAETAAADRAYLIHRTAPGGSGGADGTVVQDVLGPLAPVINAFSAPAPSTWVSQGTLAFTNSAEFFTPADAYTVTFSDIGSGVVGTNLGTLDVVYRLAWWAISDGERTRERRFIDFPSATVWDDGRRMPGMVLHSPMGASGTIEAWTLV